ncbi:MAG: PHP domain-containing protein [Acidimicrobiia bacterium]|nr:PHP domain-containing protein [Acidimicrobiia bacterium]
MPSIDLHVHSTASDGLDTPSELISSAAAIGLRIVALVDHDTLSGIPEARDSAASHDIELIPGTELSVEHGERKMHLLVYFLEPGPGPLQDRLHGLRNGRDLRNRAMVEKLRGLGYGITMGDVLAHAHGQSVGRPHIADALAANGLVPDRDTAFDDLLADGGPAYVERERLTAIDAIALARASGAVPVIAHPLTTGSRVPLRSSDWAELLRDLTDAGLGGIEAYYPQHNQRERDRFAEIARALGIAATGGSDYHGEGARRNRLGVGFGDLNVPLSAVDELIAQRR